MADIIGTPGADKLIGTAGADYLASSGTSASADWDVMIGLDGADTYALYDPSGGTIKHFIIDDRGTDGAADAIIYAGAMYHSASLGYQGWATAERVGTDLVIHLPNKPYRFHDPALPSYDITVVDHFGQGTVESLTAGGVLYRLAAGNRGTAQADIVAGDGGADRFFGLAGDDILFGNGGRDLLRLGSGNDTAFGGTGNDRILSGGGNDRVYGGDGADRIKGHGGNDSLIGEGGNDRLAGGRGADVLNGEEGNDVLRGGGGDDRLGGGAGDDRLIGGRGADIYTISANPGGPGGGHDTVIENGDTASWSTHDTIDVSGIYGPAGGSVAETFGRLSFERVGKDMVFSIDDGHGTDVTVRNMFDAGRHDRFFVEKLTINGGYWSPIEFRFLDGAVTNIGDDRTIFLSYGAKLNEILFGGDGNDQIFGGTGTNFIWTGAGADVLIYKVGDGASLGTLGGRISNDIVMDFNPAKDRLDFTEVANNIGAGFADLVISEDAEGDATIFLDTGNWEVADISIELRGVAAAQVTEAMFVF